MADDPVVQVGVVVLNYRQPARTADCLRDLAASRGVALSVFVLDNGSADGSVAALEPLVRELDAAGGPHRFVLESSPANLGFAAGQNRGLAWVAARGIRWLLVLNNDVRLPPAAIATLAAVLHNDPRVAAVSPTVVYPDGRVWAEGGEFAFAPNALRLCRQGAQPSPTELGPQERTFVPCACVLFPVAAMQRVGGFDEAFFMYWEDVDLCARLRRQGGRIVWLPWVRVEHDAGASSGGARSKLRKYLMAKNAVRCLRRHGTAAAWLGWFVFDVLLWPLALLTGPSLAFAKLRGTLGGTLGAWHFFSARNSRRM